LIVVDTSVISSLSKIGRLELLKEFSEVRTTSSVVEEALDSEISSIMESLSRSLDDWLKVSTVVAINSIRKIQEDYPLLSHVDGGLIVFCRKNDGVLLTDDRRMLEVAEEEFDIETFDLCELLLALKNEDVISEDEIEDIIEQLKKKDRYEFPEKDVKRLKGEHIE